VKGLTVFSDPEEFGIVVIIKYPAFLAKRYFNIVATPPADRLIRASDPLPSRLPLRRQTRVQPLILLPFSQNKRLKEPVSWKTPN
jgi:hypothetical protein